MNQVQTIERILCSKTFANKEVLKGLLRFMFEESQRNPIMKESDIAIAYFKRQKDFIPGDDTIVRVNVYKLRTLLTQYYANEGAKDTERVLMPRGRYGLLFTDITSTEIPKPTKRQHIVLAMISVLLIVSLFVNFAQWMNSGNQHGLGNNPILSSYAESGKPVFITLGDPYFFRLRSPQADSNDLIIRDLRVNSRDERERYRLSKIGGAKYQASELTYPYFSRNNMWPLPDIISYFANNGLETRLQALSESNIDDIRNNNIVFIANINSFGWMSRFLEKSSIRLSVNPRHINIIGKDAHKFDLSVPEQVKGIYSDYAFLVKVPGPNSNQITMMGDFHASGLRGLSGYISKASTLKKLEEIMVSRYGHFPRFFEMIVKVTSVNYADFDTRLIYFKSLE